MADAPMLLPCPDGSLLCVHDAAAGGWRVDVATFDPDAADFAWADGFLLGGGADALPSSPLPFTLPRLRAHTRRQTRRQR